MHVKGKKQLDLAAYRLMSVDILLYEAWNQSRGTDATSATWKEFKKVCNWRSERPVRINS